MKDMIFNDHMVRRRSDKGSFIGHIFRRSGGKKKLLLPMW
jgi:hypothetical protein